MTGTPARRAASMTGSRAGTPGLRTTRSASVNVAVVMAAELELDADRPQPLFLVEPIAHVGQRHRGAAADQQLRGRQAAARRTGDGDALAANGERTVCRHLSFNVVRLNSAKMIARITNRVITFGSLQPISSKW